MLHSIFYFSVVFSVQNGIFTILTQVLPALLKMFILTCDNASKFTKRFHIPVINFLIIHLLSKFRFFSYISAVMRIFL